jgi:hypothetical protein
MLSRDKDRVNRQIGQAPDLLGKKHTNEIDLTSVKAALGRFIEGTMDV